MDQCLSFLKENEQLDITPLILTKKDTEDLNTKIIQPSYALAALFTIEYAMAKLWQYWGIHPDEMIGHSMGEYVAACIAGVFSMEDGLRIVTMRGRLFESLTNQGSMVSVGLSEEEVAKYLVSEASISVINKSDNCVISGTEEAIEEIIGKLTKDTIDCSKIHIKVAAHSAQIEPIIPSFREFLESISFQEPTIPIVSNLSGGWVQPPELTKVDYWLNHLRQTVRFSDGLSTILKEHNKLLLEIGPGQTLSTFAKLHKQKDKSHVVLPSIRHPKEPSNDELFLMKTLGKGMGRRTGNKLE